jgi:hypothetical protein
MAWHTFSEAVKLTGRSRRSIHRDIAAGRISSDLDRSGYRRFETSELIRVYGPLLPVAQVEEPKLAEVVTPPDIAKVLDELQTLRAEVKELRETLLRIEHRPTPAPAAAPPVKPKPKAGPTTWGSLLDALGDDQEGQVSDTTP